MILSLERPLPVFTQTSKVCLSCDRSLLFLSVNATAAAAAADDDDDDGLYNQLKLKFIYLFIFSENNHKKKFFN